MITKLVRTELIEKYSFVTTTEHSGNMVFIYYKDNFGVEHKDSIALRANRDQLMTKIETIKKKIDYHNNKKERDSIVLKQLNKDVGAFAYTHKGETNGK